MMADIMSNGTYYDKNGNRMEVVDAAARAGVKENAGKIGVLTEEIVDINERLPEINEDGETHKLLEDTDIDDTLSVPGKVADAGAVGDAIHAVAGEYELIESVTLSEDTAFSREAEPDGTPYDFDAVMVRLTTSGNQPGTNARIMFDDKSSSLNGTAWLSTLANNIEKKRAFVWCEKCRGMWHMNLRPFSAVQSVAKLESDVLYHTAQKITGVAFTGTLAAGMTVEIYGVRAKDVSA